MPDSIPNYLHTNADGTVSAVFPGGVTTQSVSPEPTIYPYPSDPHGIRWLAADGGLVAQIGAYDNSLNPPPGSRTSDRLMMNVISPNGANSAAVELDAGNGTGNTGVFATLTADPAKSSGEVVTIIDGEDNSSFIRQMTPAAPGIPIATRMCMYGPFDTGSIGVPAGGTAFPPIVAPPTGYSRVGTIIIQVGVSVHWSVSFNCAAGAGLVVFSNFGAAQNMQAWYMQLIQ